MNAQIYRAYQREAERLEARGMEIERVRLDYELSRLDEQTVNDLQWYFFHCRRRADWSEYKSDVLKARFARCAKAYAGPRFTRLYRRWLAEGDAALTAVPPVVAEAFTSGRAVLDCRLLPHTYEHLSPLVSRRRTRRRRVTADAEEGAGTRRSLNPPLNPVP